MNATKPRPTKPGPQRPARHLLWMAPLVVLAILLLRPSKDAEPPAEPKPTVRQTLLSETSKTNDLIHVTGESEPFTGDIVEYYRDGKLKSRTCVSNGLLEGISLGWFTNGIMQVKEPFRAGKSHGKRTKWNADGSKLSEAEIVEGELHGMFRRWHENGQLSQQLPMKHGQADGVSQAWHPSGRLKARVALTNGVVVTQDFFPDGDNDASKDGDSKPSR